jgi:valyl-tRNA synthetase
MICTFGDTTDVVWWRELRLPLRSVIQRDGRFQSAVPEWLHGPGAQAWQELSGKTPEKARAVVVELLRASGDLLGDPRPIVHDVKYFEKGERPLEIVTSRQWYIRNGAQDEALRHTLVEAGRQIAWHPDFMRIRYEHWVGGLNTDWLISRQRYFGVPFPIWYPLGPDGETLWDDPILASEDALPVDPQSSPPPGFDEDQRGRPGGFVGDPDVMDTWATSSLTPQVAGGWEEDPDLFERTFPMDLRPQGPEIIRTWLFSTLLRSNLEHGTNPWANVSINGWILDPDRKKMSKSKGNVTTPGALITELGADGLRYWACSAAPGTDTAMDVGQMRVGRRLALKLLNASKFVLGLGAGGDSAAGTDAVTEPIDRSMLARLASVVEAASDSFTDHQYQQALERTERFFWDFCDDYLELVKIRAYNDNPAAQSAQAALATALSVLQRLLAPFVPFAAEEAWSWWQQTSIHRAAWPQSVDLKEFIGTAHDDVLEAAASTLRQVRKAKSEAHLGMRTPVAHLLVEGPRHLLDAVLLSEGDVRAAGVVEHLELREHEAVQFEVTLAPAAG